MKNELRGSGHVFAFTLKQTLKSKSYIIFTVIMLVLAVVSMPIVQVVKLGGKDDEKISETNITKMYVYDEIGYTKMGFDPEVVKEDPLYANLEITVIRKVQSEYDALLQKIDEEETSAVALHIYPSMMTGVTFEMVRSAQGDVTEEDTDALGEVLKTAFDAFKVTLAGVTEEQLKLLTVKMEYSVAELNTEGEVVKDTPISGYEFGILYAIIFVVMMVVIVASSQVATAIVTDKSTKVVEYLLTSVRPMALVVGKVLAMLLAAIGQMAVLVAVVFLSSYVSGTVQGKEGVLQSILPTEIWKCMSIQNIVLAFVVICFGFLFYGILAGMCGAMGSKIEEIQESLQLLTITAMIGAYLAMFAAGSLMDGGISTLTKVAMLLPVSSAFFLPGAILIGKTSAALVAASIAILIAADYLLFRFVARIYELLITHNGGNIKVKELLGIYRSLKKQGGKHALRKGGKDE